MPGPPPQPTSLKILRGNPSQHRLNMDEPKPNMAKGDCPDVLTGEARAIWERLAPELVATGRLAIEDQELLAPACWLLAKGWQYAAAVDARPIAHRGSHSLTSAVKCFDRAAFLLARFGLTPAERSRLHVRHDADRDPVDAYRAKPSRRPTS
jgi:P27 family predicted phage terminase small subunit